MSGIYNWHAGIDYNLPLHHPIASLEAGRVVGIGQIRVTGIKYIEILGDPGRRFRYMHIFANRRPPQDY